MQMNSEHGSISAQGHAIIGQCTQEMAAKSRLLSTRKAVRATLQAAGDNTEVSRNTFPKPHMEGKGTSIDRPTLQRACGWVTVGWSSSRVALPPEDQGLSSRTILPSIRTHSIQIESSALCRFALAKTFLAGLQRWAFATGSFTRLYYMFL